eukprot:CAMPEP_0203685000 /NCGR_PEP_ID=MMETSP0090-20130426/48321_1 /ASSEMBLY_ACC=CAM_ASM_001088 /TAXON_ID=426623 /ORGANISM="Chaetoceros affinis, Strain CCMP159" /LENGTH=329 /DNA_ID=CAMNT_0050554183 /DNA_START=39 /DNA_END=1028 /DNA_ORIENTATION=+
MTPDNDQEEMKTKRQNQAAAAAAAVYSSPLYFTIRFNKPCIVIATLLASGFILFLAEHTFANQIQIEKEAAIAQASIEMSSFTSSKAADSSNEDDIITEPHEIEMTLPFGSGKDKKTLAYYHCGSGAGDKSENDIEIILLHGAAFTKENWIQSEIFQNLCIKGNDKNSYNNSDGERNVSVSALDLSVGADGAGLESAFDALVEEGVLSGNPAIVVTPSASGRSIVSLVAEGNTEVLKKVVRVWMPVASFAVIGIKDDASFNIFSELNIPILAMNGDKDTKGKAVTKKLVDVADAKGVEMEGGHPCYLDSPTYFVDVIISFINGLKSDLS